MKQLSWLSSGDGGRARQQIAVSGEQSVGAAQRDGRLTDHVGLSHRGPVPLLVLFAPTNCASMAQLAHG